MWRERKGTVSFESLLEEVGWRRKPRGRKKRKDGASKDEFEVLYDPLEEGAYTSEDIMNQTT
jgi:hypothetical protein